MADSWGQVFFSLLCIFLFGFVMVSFVNGYLLLSILILVVTIIVIILYYCLCIKKRQATNQINPDSRNLDHSRDNSNRSSRRDECENERDREQDSERKTIEEEFSQLTKQIVYLKKAFAYLNSQLSKLKTPQNLGYFRNTNNRNKTNTDMIDGDKKTLNQLCDRFDESIKDTNELLSKESFRPCQKIIK